MIWAELGITIIKIALVFFVVLTLVAYLTLAERRVSAFIQDRLGPNRVGPFGFLQPLADGVKFIFKEEKAVKIIPSHDPEHLKQSVNNYFYIYASNNID